MANSQRPPLLAYVMKFGGLDQLQAEQWLDAHCPRWNRKQEQHTGAVVAGQVRLDKAGGENECDE